MEFEYAILDFIRNNLASDVLDRIMRAISFLGDAGFIWIVLAITLMFFKRTRVIGLTIACALILSLIGCNAVLKPLIARVRPYELKEGISLIINAPTDYSFPSGHTSASFAAAVALFMHSRKWGISALVLATLIAFSRLYLYVHFPTDILGGIIIGSLCGIGAYILTSRIYKKLLRK